MYRSIYSMTERQTNGAYGTTIYLNTWNEKGEPIQQRFEHVHPYLYYEATPETEHLATAKSIFGDSLIKKSFVTQSQRKKWINDHPGVRLYENLPVTRQFLLNYYHGKERKDDFRKNKFKIWTIDIEIAVAEADKFPEASLAERPVNLITIHDSILNEYFIWYMPPKGQPDITKPYVEKGIEPPTPEEMLKRHYFRFESETKLLADFFTFWADHRPDILTGWNISAFDMPYLFNRGTKILGVAFDVPSMLSPAGTCYFIDDENVMTKILKITGVSIIDYMYLYKFKFEKGKPSYALDNILDEELGLGKLDHSEYPSFYEFYTQNFSKYVEYNIMDVERVVRLDKKKRFIDLAVFLCHLGLVEYEAIYHTLPYVQGAVQAQAKYHNLCFLTDTGLPEPESSFKGAYVHDTRAGFYKRGGYTFDLNSLYPNIMILINCSPETKIGKIIEENGDQVTIRPLRGPDKTTTKEILNSILKDKCCISANKVLYYKPEIKKGIMPEFLEFLYDERRATKNKGLKLQAELNEMRVNGITSGEKVEQYTTAAELYNNAQQAYKIMLNSVYGIIGLRHYCCFDVDNAEAVTQSGQHVIKTSLDYIADIHKEKLGYEGIHPTLAGDTDSLMNDGSPVYHKLFGDKNIEWTKEEVAQFKGLAGEICDELNDRIANHCKEYFHSSLRRIEFKLETVFTHACFLKRKHYVYRMADKEGAYMIGSKKQFKYTGVDIRRVQLSKTIQSMLKYCVEHGMLEEWSDAKYHEYFTELYEKFKQLDISEIAFRFTYRTKREAAGFLQMEKGAHITAKVATFYNQLLDYLKLNDYEHIKLGDMAKYVKVKVSNPFGIDVVGFKEGWPPEFNNLFEVDYDAMFSKLCTEKISGFIDVFGWTKFDPSLRDNPMTTMEGWGNPID